MDFQITQYDEKSVFVKFQIHYPGSISTLSHSNTYTHHVGKNFISSSDEYPTGELAGPVIDGVQIH